jgi:hypothetical protein
MYKLWKEDLSNPELGYQYMGSHESEQACHDEAARLGLADYRIELKTEIGITIVFEN